MYGLDVVYIDNKVFQGNLIMKKFVVWFVCVVMFVFVVISGYVQIEVVQVEMRVVVVVVNEVVVKGLIDIDVKYEVVLKLKVGELFVLVVEVGCYLCLMGNVIDEVKLVGFVLFDDLDVDWILVVLFELSGYICDDDVKDWKFDELLKSLQVGIEENNLVCKVCGLFEIEVVGWVKVFVYDVVMYWFVWLVIICDKGVVLNVVNDGVNYWMFVFGCDGYLLLMMVLMFVDLLKYKVLVDELLLNICFNDGKCYVDFNQLIDYVVEYGFVVLIVGVGVKKFGLFVLIGVFVVKFFKIGVVVLLVGGVVFKCFFGCKLKVVVVLVIVDVFDVVVMECNE